jgi:hypothetical protein
MMKTGCGRREGERVLVCIGDGVASLIPCLLTIFLFVSIFVEVRSSGMLTSTGPDAEYCRVMFSAVSDHSIVSMAVASISALSEILFDRPCVFCVLTDRSCDLPSLLPLDHYLSSSIPLIQQQSISTANSYHQHPALSSRTSQSSTSARLDSALSSSHPDLHSYLSRSRVSYIGIRRPSVPSSSWTPTWTPT